MTDKEILQKSVLKAKKNGFDLKRFDRVHFICGNISTEEGIKREYYYILIFSHDFAKAFWGEKFIDLDDVYINEEYDVSSHFKRHFKKWEYHLQQMILKEEPLKYLERFLDK
jgi:hypothetical protein